MDHIVIGNGIIALATAFRLCQRMKPGESLTIIGPESRTGSATLAAAAMLNSFAELEPGSLDSPEGLYHFELSHLATQMWPDFEREIIDAAGSSLPSECGKCQILGGGGCYGMGTYVVNNSATSTLDDDNYDTILSALLDFNEPHQEVDPKSIPGYHPEQQFRATRALHLLNEGWLNPRIVIKKLQALLEQHEQVTLIDGNVEKLVAANGKIDRVVLQDGQEYSADSFMMLNGAGVTDLIQKSGLNLPIQRVFYGVGTSLELSIREAPFNNCIRTPNRGLACGLYAAPYFQSPEAEDNRVLVGATNFVSKDPYPYGRLSAAEGLMRSAMEQINRSFYRADLIQINVGWRPTSLDTFPMIGKTSIPNLVIATGTKRDGFHLAPVISKRLVSILYDEIIEEDIILFAPERTPIRSLTREQAIEKGYRHILNAAYQHDYNPPKGRLGDRFEATIKDDLEKLHDDVGADSWGIPPEMLDMYRYGHDRY